MSGQFVWTIGNILSWTTEYFKKHDIESPRLDAEILLSHVLKKKRIYLYTEFERILDDRELALFKSYIQKRLEGFSPAAIIGKKEFMGLDFLVNPHVLIPRPDTETWVEKVIQYHRNDSALNVADLGTGSGAILLSFLYYAKDATGVGVDISPEALAVAEKNGENLVATDRVEWREGDYLSAFHEGEVFDGIFSNPPYIPSDEIETLAVEVRQEPHLALDGGADGLDFYRKLIDNAHRFIKSGGFLAIELGIGQCDTVVKWIKETGVYHEPEVINDYGGIERAIYVRKK